MPWNPAGGAASRAPLEARVEVFSGDLSEPVGPPGASPLRILAVWGDQRLAVRFAHLPTVREHGCKLQSASWRGLSLGGPVPAGRSAP